MDTSYTGHTMDQTFILADHLIIFKIRRLYRCVYSLPPAPQETTDSACLLLMYSCLFMYIKSKHTLPKCMLSLGGSNILTLHVCSVHKGSFRYSDCDCDVTFPLMLAIAKCE